jgi:SAM-dependent methyltransferase
LQYVKKKIVIFLELCQKERLMETIKYDRIGKGYNNSRKADPYLLDRLFFHLQPTTEEIYLDIGCGTGNYSISLWEKGVSLIGIDPSEAMLSVARERNKYIDWRKGSCDATGLQPASLGGILAFLSVHHWPDIHAAFQELASLLRKKGRAVLFTSTPEQMEGYWLNEYFPDMLCASIAQMPSYECLSETMTAAGLKLLGTEKYFVKNTLQDHFLYCGKNRPALYLDKIIRQGISSFSDLANKQEVTNGLKKLEQDIHSGRIVECINAYENQKGDYLFLIAEKV